MKALFKDLYKKANDKIDTSAAKSRVLENISNYSKPRRNFHTLQYAAAMAACAAVTFAGINLFNETDHVSEDLINIPSNTEISTRHSDNTEKNDNNDNIHSVQTHENVSESTKQKNKTQKKSFSLKEQKKMTEPSNEPVSITEEQSMQQTADKTDDTPVIDSPVQSEETEVSVAMSLSLENEAPAGGMSRKAVFDISEIFVLPENMEKINSDSEEYIFSGDGKYVKIKYSDDVPDTDFENSDIYKTLYFDDFKADVYKNDNTFNALFYADFNYNVYCENFTESELEQLLLSLI